MRTSLSKYLHFPGETDLSNVTWIVRGQSWGIKSNFFLSSTVPNLPEHIRYAIVAGAVTGGGLTVIANAPNPAGQAILGKYFKDGISALQLFLWAALPTFIIFCLYNFIYFGN